MSAVMPAGDAVTRLARGKDRYLQEHHVAAAARVARYFERACLRQRVTMMYEPVQTGGKGSPPSQRGEFSDMAMDARKALSRIYEILPRECAELVIDVCGFDKPLQELEQARQWPRRSAKLVLRIGLDRLAAEYGLTPVAVGPAHAKKPAAWMAEGARPTDFF